jgi:Ca-activated chloride channel homolog
MQLAQPLWIFAGIILCAGLIVLSKFLDQRKQIALRNFAAAHLLSQLTRNISWPKRKLKFHMCLFAILLCCIALARPQYGSNWIEVRHKGIDILFALDTSKSMLAEDFKPNRLERARYAIMDFVDQLSGDRVGLLPFAGSAFLSCPLTLDYSAFEETLASINTETIPLAGTNLAAVIAEAERVLTASGNHKILILLTDGENLQGDALAAAKEAAAKGLIIHTVSVGTRDGDIVPAGDGSFLKDTDGKFITSRLDEKTLKELADISGGIAVPLGDRGQGLETVYRQKLALIEKSDLGERRQQVPIERYFWPLALAILLLAVEFLLTERKPHGGRQFSFFRKTKPREGQTGKAVTALLVLLLLDSISGRPVLAGQAEDSYARGEYPKASELYRRVLEKNPDDPHFNYNFGTAAYKNNDFDEAIASFSKALITDDLEMQAMAYYNKANSHYKKGIELQETNRPRTIEEWQNALDAYSAALKLNPEDADARYNHEVVSGKLADLTQQQEKEQQNQPQSDNSPGETTQPDHDRSGQDKPARQQPAQSSSRKDQQDPPQIAGQRNEPQQANEGNPANDPPHVAGNEPGQQLGVESRKDGERRSQGKMTGDEAQKLLRSLKGEEEIFNIIPAAPAGDAQPKRNW